MRQAQAVTIVRDEWGIAHVQGGTDADAVFGAMYAQAEDDFNRIETNYLNSLGRLAEVEGERAIFRDLRMKLFVDPRDLRAKFAASPPWLRQLMTAWADGLNYFLHTHPQVRTRLLTHFEPWMALSFSEGSIGGDIERIPLAALEAFYGGTTRTAATRAASAAPAEPAGPAEPDAAVPRFPEPTGSNGIAIAPANTVDHHALLLINPHTSFFFRSELQMTSAHGLNAYGAATWGQFFVYQGFNASAGWMHTSSGIDNVDEFAETIVRRAGRLYYRYGDRERPVQTTTIVVPYRGADGQLAQRSFTVFRTLHGPIIREQAGRWISIALLQKPVEALQQSWLRTKAHDLAGFLRVAQLKANSSNNTLFASAAGEIAYLHPQFVPRRDARFDYTQPVDGSDAATDWQGLHALDELPRAINPAVGWVMNTNNWPYSAAGPDSPRRADFPRYMDVNGENPRGEHALQLLTERHDFTPQALMAAAYDTFQPAFARLIPALVAAWERSSTADPLRAQLAPQIDALRGWDYRWSVDSVPTSLAVYWGDTLRARLAAGPRANAPSIYDVLADATDAQRLEALAAAAARLTQDFGRWQTPWGEINRYQRLNGAIAPTFSDAAPSIPVGFTSATWGSLAAFGAVRPEGAKRYYGTKGNSFVAVVEFAPQVRAWAVSAGGESGDPASPHFNDQAERYASGALREVYFHPEQIARHAQARYHPGR